MSRPGTVDARICFFDEHDSSMASLPDFSEIVVASDRLPAGMHISMARIEGGKACGSMTVRLDESFPAELRRVSVPLSARTFRGGVLIYTTANLVDFAVAQKFATLEVKIGGLPIDSVLAKGLQLTGPGGFNETIKADKQFRVPEGTYTLSAAPNPARIDDPIVSTVFESPSPAGAQTINLPAGATRTLSVTYVLRNGTGRLWFASDVDNSLLAYTAGQLSSAPSPMTAIAPNIRMHNPASNTDAKAFSFTRSGDLAVLLPDNTNAEKTTAVGYFAANLLVPGIASGTAATHSSQGTDDLADFPASATFDRAGNLWVTNINPNGNILRIPAASLGAGTFTPDVVLTGINVRSLALNFNGDMYFGDAKRNRIYRIPSADTLAAGTYDPNLGGAGITFFRYTKPTTINSPTGLVFDRVGNLWVQDTLNSRITRIPSTDLPVAGSKDNVDATNYIRLEGPNTTILGPTAMAFDNSGNLWTTNTNPRANELLSFQVSTLMPGVNDVAPQKRITHSSILPVFGDMRFNSVPCGLPLFD